MERAEVLFVVLTHVATTSCETVVVEHLETVRQFLQGWGRSAMTSARHFANMPAFQERARALQAEEELEVAWQSFWESTVPGASFPAHSLNFIEPSSPASSETAEAADHDAWWRRVYGGGPPPPPDSPGSDASDRTIGSYS